MERLVNTKGRGINRSTLRKWGMLFLAAGVIGRGVIQGHILGVGSASIQQMMEVIESMPNAMNYATASIILQILETCAAPIFALLLVEGFQHTSDYKQYLLRVLGVAALTEIPYNLAMGAKLLDFGSRNPVFAMALGLIMMYFYHRYSGGGISNFLIKAVITAAAIVWVEMLRIEFGICLLLIIFVLWVFRQKPLYRNFAGASAAIACSLFNPFFLASPMGFLAVHLYNGENAEEDPRVIHLFYPVILLAAAIAGWLLF